MQENSFKKNFFVVILSTTVVFDALNGIISMYISTKLELLIPLIRIIIMVFFLLYFMAISSMKFRKTLIILLIFLFITNLSMFIQQSSISIVYTSNIFLSKIFYFYILLQLLDTLTLKKILSIEDIKKILITNSFLMPLLIIIPTKLGLARQTYANSDLGSSGFFLANNSTNFVLITTTGFLLFLLIDEKFKIFSFNFMFFILSLYSLWLQGSKTSYFFLILYILVFLVCFIKKYLANLFGLLLLTILMAFLILLGTHIYYNFSNYEKLWTNAISSFSARQAYARSFHDNIFSYLNSGRTSFLENNTNLFFNHYNVLFLLTGIGSETIVQATYHLSEMDFFDILFSTGLLGIILTYGSSLKQLKIFILKKNKKSVYLALNLIFLLIFSFFAGHVFVDIISSTFVALLLVSIQIYTRNRI